MKYKETKKAIMKKRCFLFDFLRISRRFRLLDRKKSRLKYNLNENDSVKRSERIWYQNNNEPILDKN